MKILRFSVRSPGALLLWILLLLAGSAGCTTHYLRGSLEKRIADRLGSLIGPANHYTVRIEGTRDAELVQGKLRRIAVEGRNVLVSGEIRLARLRLEAEGIRFRGGPDRLERVRWSHLRVEITEAALNEYLPRAHQAEEARVALHEGEVTISGVFRLLGTPVPLEARGVVEIADGRQVLFRAREVHAPAIRLSDGGARFVERQVNPLVDVGEINWPVRLEAIRVHDDRVILEGVLDLPRQERS